MITKTNLINCLQNVNTQNEIKSYLKKTSKYFICLTNNKIAEKICQTIFKDFKDENTYIFEASPGYGVLTEQLLIHHSGKIRVFEYNPEKRLILEQLKVKYNYRMEILDKQILDLGSGNYKLLNFSREDIHNECFNGIPINWVLKSNEPNKPFKSSFLFFSALSPFFAREFLSYLNYSVVRFETFFESGPNEFYLFIPLSIFKTIVSKPSKNLNNYTAFTIHVNSLFDYDVIDLYSPELNIKRIKVEDKYYSVISGRDFDYTSNRKVKPKEEFVFMKLKPKRLIIEVNQDYLIDYMFFVKQSFMKRTNNVIKYYENLFPGCTIDLIGLGISYFKSLGDLTCEEMFNIFNYVYKLPQYQNSIFKC